MLTRQPIIYIQLSLITLITLFCTVNVQALEQRTADEANGKSITLFLERDYLDGEVSVEIKREPYYSQSHVLARYPGWRLVEKSEKRIVLRKSMNDISPFMKANGYFGLNNEGILSIFDGKPNEEGKVIQSFFQIDVGKLETKRHMELENGIRVASRKKYLHVIETFKQYGTPCSKK
ncbi:BofC C-terminal domain-containing protein [Metabacillus sp. KIGAM252]|uniref:BofC C-terminal domain-containing protein n=1 Tax=Metabacillus flavus TaxID=2823519 RepID=A0ABS5LGY3_9BACI|nr:BofC C-terminal domain-containing protein [Metabacillus flavus]MBS2969854.1 BofC C-terminal domain-containing protein [Metabacillus flavus]